jgi:hypothetical protein
VHTRLLQFLVGVIVIGAAQAAPVLHVVPADGVISATPGSTAGWGFTFENSTDYAVITQAALSDTLNVDFMDFISPPFVVIGPDGAFAQSFWAQPFDATAQTGIGAATVHAGLLPGTSIPETISIFYDLYSVSPLDPAFDPANDGISFGNMIQADASIDVVAPVPEPGSLFGVGIGCLVFLIGRKRVCR